MDNGGGGRGVKLPGEWDLRCRERVGELGGVGGFLRITADVDGGGAGLRGHRNGSPGVSCASGVRKREGDGDWEAKAGGWESFSDKERVGSGLAQTAVS
jgi:hypothetical protein